MGGRVPAGLWDHTGGCRCYVCAPVLGGWWRLGRDTGLPCSCSFSPTQVSRVHRNSVSVQVSEPGERIAMEGYLVASGCRSLTPNIWGWNMTFGALWR